MHGTVHKEGEVQETTHEASRENFEGILKGEFKGIFQDSTGLEQIEDPLPSRETSGGVEWDCREGRYEFHQSELGKEVEKQGGAGRESAVRARDDDDALFDISKEHIDMSGGGLPTRGYILPASMLREVSGSVSDNGRNIHTW